jgi:hypothetical protein
VSVVAYHVGATIRIAASLDALRLEKELADASRLSSETTVLQPIVCVP